MEKFILAIDPGAKTGIVVFDTASGTITSYPAAEPAKVDWSACLD